MMDIRLGTTLLHVASGTTWIVDNALDDGSFGLTAFERTAEDRSHPQNVKRETIEREYIDDPAQCIAECPSCYGLVCRRGVASLIQEHNREVVELRTLLNNEESNSLGYATEAEEAREALARALQKIEVLEGTIESLHDNFAQYQSALSDTLVGLGLLDEKRVAEIGVDGVLLEMAVRVRLPPHTVK